MPIKKNQQTSLSFQLKKRQQQQQIEENLQMLKKIHEAKPSVNFDEHLQHQKRTKKLSKMIGMSSSRQHMLSTVRSLCFYQTSQESKSYLKYARHHGDKGQAHNSSAKHLGSQLLAGNFYRLNSQGSLGQKSVQPTGNQPNSKLLKVNKSVSRLAEQVNQNRAKTAVSDLSGHHYHSQAAKMRSSHLSSKKEMKANAGSSLSNMQNLQAS
jgi:hypothetical protein